MTPAIWDCVISSTKRMRSRSRSASSRLCSARRSSTRVSTRFHSGGCSGTQASPTSASMLVECSPSSAVLASSTCCVVQPEVLGEVRAARHAAELLGEVRDRAAQDVGGLLDRARRPHRPAVVAQVAAQQPGHGHPGEVAVRGLRRVVAVERLDEPAAGDLDEVVVLAARAVAAGRAGGQPQVQRHHLVADRPTLLRGRLLEVAHQVLGALPVRVALASARRRARVALGALAEVVVGRRLVRAPACWCSCRPGRRSRSPGPAGPRRRQPARVAPPVAPSAGRGPAERRRGAWRSSS